MTYAQFLEARRRANEHWRRWQKLADEATYDPTPANRAAAGRELARYRLALSKVQEVRTAWLGGRDGDGGSAA